MAQTESAQGLVRRRPRRLRADLRAQFALMEDPVRSSSASWAGMLKPAARWVIATTSR